MSKIMEGVYAQTGRTRLKNQRPQQCDTVIKINSNQMEQNSDGKMLHQVNFRFEAQGINRKDPRVHSKQGSRRVGGKVVIQRQKQIGEKLNKGPRRSSKAEENSLRDSSSQVILMGIKSCLGQEDKAKTTSNNQKQTRYSSNAQSYSSPVQGDQSININTVPKKSTDQIFREITRRMEEEIQSAKIRRTQQNCFFYNFKQKLQRELIHIEGQTQRNQAQLMIEGCEIQKHRINGRSAVSLTDRSRPKSAINSARTYSSAAKIQRKLQGPLSCQSRSQVSSHDIIMLQAQSQRLLGKREEKSERNTTRDKQCQRKYIKNSLITFDNFSSLKPYKSTVNKTKNKHVQDNQRLNYILNECFTHQAAFSDVTNKMRTFEYYCKKMSAAMEKAGNKLEQLNESAQFHD